MKAKIDRLKKTATHGMVGGIAGYIVEQGLEAATGVDFINGVFEIAGAALGMANANRDLLELVYSSAKEITGKEPVDMTNEEWEQVREKYPKAVDYLERALSLQ